jgi:hypothetical protein
MRFLIRECGLFCASMAAKKVCAPAIVRGCGLFLEKTGGEIAKCQRRVCIWQFW